MQKILDYTILEKIDETRSSYVYRGQKDGYERTVIIKALKTRSPSLSEIARFKHEYAIIKNIDLDGIVKNHAFGEYDEGFALVFEDFKGISLKEVIKNETFDIASFLKTGIKLSETLGTLHKQNIIHKDIKPQNIIIDRDSGQVKITDFGIAAVLTHENDAIFNPEVIKGTLAYMSPEQTGRMNREVDYRTDMYSLGITFYEMLTGILPFEFSDPLEIMHAHIAREPLPPIALDNSIPEILSDITMKLISKMAEDRYQNGFGLMADLKECLKRLDDKGAIDKFEHSQKDIPIKFQIPQLLVGREKEIDILMRSFDQVVSSGEESIPSQLMLVSGNPGIGKSALINEIHKLIIVKKGYFISGKYDQFKGDVPYSAIVQVFQELVGQILTEGEERINIWKENLLKAFGTIGKVITDVIPMISLITGEQPDVPELSGEKSMNRFHYAFKKFVAALAGKDHPLILFLDDLQWADPASLKLIEILITDPEISSFYMIGAYRSNEVDESHRFARTLERLKNANVSITEISLKPLSEIDVNALISSFMRCDKETSLPLAEIVHKKTRGNPFFVNMFVKTLYEENLLLLDFEYGWRWEIENIKKIPLTDNVVDILIKKITTLPEETQAILKICACIGNQFDLQTISHISGKLIDEVLAHFSLSTEEGFVYLSGDTYQFQHDQIQAAVYKMMPKEENEALHYRIGNFLLENVNEKELQDKIIDIVDQLNVCRSLISSPEEVQQLSELNLRAGQKARTSAAYESALAYFKIGIDLSGIHCWKSNYDLSLSLHNEAAEAAYMNTQYNEFKYFSEIVLNNAKTLLDRVNIYELQILVCIAEHKPLEAVQIGIKTLKMLGVRFPEKPRIYHIIFNLLKTKFKLRNKTKDELANMPAIKDPFLLAARRINSNVGTPAYYAAPNLLPLIVFKSILLSIKHGNPPHIPYVYACYGFIISSIGNFDAGYEFGEFGVQLLDKLDARDQFARTHFVMNVFTRHWKEHIRNTIKPFILASEIAFETGDIEFACHNLMGYSYHSYYSGCELTELEKTSTKNSAITLRLKQKIQFYTQSLYLETMRILQGKDEYSSQMIGSAFNEEELLPLLIESGDKTNIATLHFQKMTLNYFFGDYQLGLSNSEESKKYLDATKGTFSVVISNFFDSLLRLAVYPLSSNKKYIIKQVIRNQKKLKKWAQHAPMNHLHKFNLVEGELARVKGESQKAIKYYKLAIHGAHENKFIQEEGLANEIAGRYWLDEEMEDYAKIHINEAHRCYKQWGAHAKVKHLEKKYPELFEKKSEKDSSGEDESKTDSIATTKIGSTTTKNIDISTIMKTSQHLSSEIDLGSLLEKIMKLSIENAGAQKGCLILENDNDNKLYIEASGGINEPIITLQSIAVDVTDDLPPAIVNYVARTKETVILDNASAGGAYKHDPYIVKNNIKSVLCRAILNRGKLYGILYLENNLSDKIFTPQRLEVLDILSSQAAISIDNARLYENLEDKVKERTAQLKDAQAELIENAHKAGMADIATGTLHNIGNILNSVITSTEMIKEKNRSVALKHLKKANELLNTNIDDLANFITNNPKGKKLLEYYHSLNDLFEKEKEEIDAHVIRLLDKTNVIVEILLAQQSYAGTSAFIEKCNLIKIINDAIMMQQNNLDAYQIKIIKQFDDIPEIPLQKAKLIHILVNIIKNAQEAMIETPESNRKLMFTVYAKDKNVFLKIQDSGIGVLPENFNKIFNHGFTTKKDGHGFGLHTCANYMTEMGGKIWAERPSTHADTTQHTTLGTGDGEGTGVTFVLEFSV